MRAENSNFRVVSAADKAEIYLYDVIGADFFGGITAKMFADELNGLKGVKAIDVRINSPGGDVFDGFTMFSLLRQHKAKVNVYVDGLAASIASVIAMAGDSIEISANGYMMIHNPWSVTIGTADDMRKQADLLDKIRDSIVETYASRTKGDQSEIQDLMSAETWLNSSESVEKGFADRIGEQATVAAALRPDLLKFRNIPTQLLNAGTPTRPASSLEELEKRIRTKLLEGRTENAA